jgi:hypothetical protein
VNYVDQRIQPALTIDPAQHTEQVFMHLLRGAAEQDRADSRVKNLIEFQKNGTNNHV